MPITPLATTPPQPDAVLTVACAPAEKLIACGSESGAVKVYRWDGTTKVLQLDTDLTARLAADAKTLPAAGTPLAAAFDPRGSALLLAGEDPPYVPRLMSHAVGTWNPNGTVVGVAAVDRARVAFAVGKAVKVAGPGGAPADLGAASSDIRVIAARGDQIATGHDGGVTFWDPSAGSKVEADLPAKTVGIAYAGDQLCTVDDAATPVVRVWRPTVGGVTKLPGAPQDITAAAASADGTRVAAAWTAPSGQDFMVQVWDADGTAVAPPFKSQATGPIERLALSGNGERVAWSAPSKDKTGFANADGSAPVTLAATTNKVTALAVAVGNTAASVRVAVGFASGTIEVFNGLGMSTPPTLADHTAAVTALAFQADFDVLYSGSADKSVIRRNLQTPTQLVKLSNVNDPVSALAVDGPDRIAAATGSGAGVVVRFWPTSADPSPWVVPVGKPVSALALAGTAPFLAAGTADKVVRVWDTLSRLELRPFRAFPHASAALALRADADGPTTLTSVGTGANRDLQTADVGVVRAFPIDTNKPVTAFAATADRVLVARDRQAAAFTLDGKQDGVVSGAHPAEVTHLCAAGGNFYTVANDTTIRRWNPATGALADAVTLPAVPTAAAATPAGKFLAVGFDGIESRLYSPDGTLSVALRGSAKVTDLVVLPNFEAVTASGKGDMTWWDGLGPRGEFRTSPAAGTTPVTGAWAAADADVRFVFAGPGRDAIRVDYKDPPAKTTLGLGADRLAVAGGGRSAKALVAVGGANNVVNLIDAAGKFDAVAATKDVGGEITALGFNGDQTVVVAGTATGGVARMTVANGPALPDLTPAPDKHTSVVKGVAFNPAGSRLASLGNDGVVRVHNPATLAEVAKLSLGPTGKGLLCYSLGWLDDSTMVVGAADGRAHVLGVS